MGTPLGGGQGLSAAHVAERKYAKEASVADPAMAARTYARIHDLREGTEILGAKLVDI
jgi:hypothetical protein